MQYEIIANAPLNPSVWDLRLRGDASAFVRPGQFAQLAVPGFYLRRPISVCDRTDDGVRLVYKAVGPGTQAMTRWLPGGAVDLLPGLGNGFSVGDCGERPLLVGGGVGLPPLLWLARRLRDSGRTPTVLAGFGAAAEAFLLDDFRALAVPLTVTTIDGSLGIRGLVTDALPRLSFDSLCACGPIPMMKALRAAVSVPGQYSLEERMGCGFGACMGCSVETKRGSARVCREGPVFRGEELIWP